MTDVFRMQAQAPEAVVSQESEQTQAMYSIDDKSTACFGKNCLLARRLVERGVNERLAILFSHGFKNPGVIPGSGAKQAFHAKLVRESNVQIKTKHSKRRQPNTFSTSMSPLVAIRQLNCGSKHFYGLQQNTSSGHRAEWTSKVRKSRETY